MSEEVTNEPDLESADMETLDRAMDENADRIFDEIMGRQDPPSIETREEPEVAAPAVESEAPAAEETADPPVAAAPAPDAEPEPFDFNANLIEIERAQREKVEADLERQRFLADRNAGMLGHLMKKVEALESGDRRPAREEYEEAAERETPAPVASSELQRELQEIRSERVSRALAGVEQDFYAQNREFFGQVQKVHGAEVAQTLLEDFRGRITQQPQEVRDVVSGTDAKLAATTARAVFRSALADAKIAFLERLGTAAREKTASQVPESRRRKLEAADVSGSASSQVKTESKTLQDASPAEIDAEMERQFGRKSRLRR